MTKTTVIRSLYGLVLLCCFVVAAGAVYLLHSKQFVFTHVAEQNSVKEVNSGPFPVSVDVVSQTIT